MPKQITIDADVVAKMIEDAWREGRESRTDAFIWDSMLSWRLSTARANAQKLSSGVVPDDIPPT